MTTPPGCPGPERPGAGRGTVAAIYNSAVAAWAIAAGAFDEVYRYKSFFHWLSRGNAELFRQMPSVLVGENRAGDFYQRDAAAIAYACREIDELCYAPTFWDAMERLDFELSNVVDVGCGSGGRVLDILARYPRARGIGVDIARPALDVARASSRARGAADRVTFVQADVLDLDERPEFADIELITCFMMGHDLWPRENCVAALRRFRKVFPSAQRFLPTVADWESLFDEAGWELMRTNMIDMTVGEVVFELG